MGESGSSERKVFISMWRFFFIKFRLADAVALCRHQGICHP